MPSFGRHQWSARSSGPPWLPVQCLLLLALAPTLPAIDPNERLSSLSVSHWGAENGIPEETFASLLAPGDGYIWLASNHGLVRFDGTKAVTFLLGDTYRAQGTGPCSSNTLSSLHFSRSGQIWIGSNSGCLFRLDRDRFGGFTNFRHSAREAPTPDREINMILAIQDSPARDTIEIVRRSGISLLPPAGPFETVAAAPSGVRLSITSRAPDGSLWATGANGNLYRLTANSDWESFGPWSAPRRATAQRLLAARDGTLWIASNQGLFHWRHGRAEPETRLPSGHAFALHEDAAGCLWVGQSQSVARICGDRVESIPVGVDQEELLSSIAEDPEGTIWLGGRWGNLYRIAPTIFQSYTRRDGLPESHLTGAAVDRDGRVWISLRESGLARIASQRLDAQVRHPAIAETQALIAHPQIGVITAGPAGLFHVNGPVPIPLAVSPPIPTRTQSALGWDRQGRLLYSNVAANYRLTPAPGGRWLAETIAGPPRFRQWAADSKGQLWALAQFHGLHLLAGNAYRPAPNAEPGRARAWYSITADKEDLLWIGTTDGVEIYSPAAGRFLSDKPFLFGDQVFHITHDAAGFVWCATRDGIVRFSRNAAIQASNPATLLFERFSQSHSLPTTNFGLVTSATGATTPDGRIWFPGLLGLVSVNPATLTRTPRPPHAVLLQFSADGHNLDLNQPLSVPPGPRNLEFLFRTVRLDPLAADLCRLRLEGWDAAWRPCNAQRSEQYTAIPPGDYTFIVQTSSRAGEWNGPELRVPLRLVPAPLERTMVRVAIAIALAATIVLLLRRRHRGLVERTRELEKHVEERTANLAKAMQDAQSASRAKSEFVATMSHEIRTPMNGVLGAVQLLDSSPLSPDQQKLVSVIRQSGEDLIGIVDDILCLAKVEAGKLGLEIRPVAIATLAEQIAALFRPKAESKNVRLLLEVDPATPAVIGADPQRLRQILLNLVGNAVKFTDSGHVSIRISADPATRQLCLRVTDTGIGIAADKIAHLFEPFVQADSSTTRRYGGSGLGLSIVRRLVDAMGGQIAVESLPGAGASFSVTIPYSAPPAPAPTATPAISAPPDSINFQEVSVLLAEDNATNQLIFQRMLLRLGCRVVVANHGREALDALKSAEFDLVFMDCQMPELDGYQTTREIRSLGGRFAELPIIALTASAMAEDRQNCFEAGMNDFLSKPLVLANLQETLLRWSPVHKPSSKISSVISDT